MSVYCAADFHGCYWIWEQIKEILKPEDRLYFLGDAADRGPYGWKIIKELLNDSRVIYIKGNHEDLMINAIGDWIPYDEDKMIKSFWNYDIELWYQNGGEITHIAFEEDDTISNQEKANILYQIKNLPVICFYYNTKNQKVILSHSGYDDYEYGDKEHFIWDRTHLMFYDAWDGDKNEVIVHGHTPIDIMVEDQDRNAAWAAYDMAKNGNAIDKAKSPTPWPNKGAYWYAKNHKCNIDTGAVWSNTAVLLNLDTWEEIILNKNKKGTT